jgi:hypothetical protein
VVWQGSDGDESETFLFYDGTTVKQLTNNSYLDLMADQPEWLVVWETHDFCHDWEIFHDGVSIIQPQTMIMMTWILISTGRVWSERTFDDDVYFPVQWPNGYWLTGGY